MKNIYVLPTDKPSRLHLYTDENGTRLSTCELEFSHTRNTQHVYIISNEPINKGDYFILIDGLFKGYITNDYEKTSDVFSRKIILSNDQELTENGIQELSDTFLNWFCENYTCEYIKVESKSIQEIACDWWDNLNIKQMDDLEYRYDIYRRKVAITENNILKMYCSEKNLPVKPFYELIYKISYPQKEERKQTIEEYTRQGMEKYLGQELEEVSEKEFNFLRETYPSIPQKDVRPFKLGVANGIKYIQGKLYSEDEVERLLDFIKNNANETDSGWQMNGISYTNKEIIQKFKNNK